MMFNSLKLIDRWLCRTDRHPPVDLTRIGRKNRCAIMERQTDAQVRLARTRRTDHDQQSFNRHRRSCRRPRNR